MSSPRTPLNAVVLAGGGADDPLARGAGTAAKALVPIDGAPMGAYVCSALRASGVIDRIVYVGPSDPGVAPLVDAVVPAGRRMVDSMALGFGAALAAEGGAAAGARLLMVTADVPWWSAAGVASFVEQAPDVDLVYPVVSAETALATFPNQRRTFARLADGRFTGGNAVLLSHAGALALLPVIDAAFQARKAPWRLARLIGFDVVWALVTRRARIAALEARVSGILGVAARVYLSDDAAIAADVDDPSQLTAEAMQGPPLAALLGTP